MVCGICMERELCVSCVRGVLAFWVANEQGVQSAVRQ